MASARCFSSSAIASADVPSETSRRFSPSGRLSQASGLITPSSLTLPRISPTLSANERAAR